MNYHSVLRDIRSGKLRATRKGKGYRVKLAWYEEWLEADIVVPLRRPRRSPPPPRRGPTEAGTVADLDAIEREEHAA